MEMYRIRETPTNPDNLYLKAESWHHMPYSYEAYRYQVRVKTTWYDLGNGQGRRVLLYEKPPAVYRLICIRDHRRTVYAGD
jgi:hypothetical protein